MRAQGRNNSLWSTTRQAQPRRRTFHPAAECLEERLAPAATGLLSTPIVTPSAIGRAGADPAVVTWLEDVAGVVLGTRLPSSSVSAAAERIARGLSPVVAIRRLLDTPAARLATTRQSFELLLGRLPTAAELSGPLRDSRPAQLLARLAASREYLAHAGGTDAAWKAAVARDLLGGHPLPAALAGLPAVRPSERLALVGRLVRTPVFAQAWTARLARMALEQGQFPADLIQSATRQLRQPDGFRLVLARFLATPQSRRDVLRRASPPTPPPGGQPVTIGPTLPNYAVASRLGLIPDRVTDPPAYGDPDAAPAGSSGVPLQSPWGQAIVFPEVPYASVMTGTAPQPILTLPESPTDLLSKGLPQGGVTFQTWFQAKSPGALLSEVILVDGQDVEVPLISINSQNKLVGGLFDGSTLVPNQNQTSLLEWTPQSVTNPPQGGQTQGGFQLGPPNPVVSVAPVVDNTWHHVALVVTAGLESLYLDGQLAGQVLPLTGTSYSFLPTLASGSSPSGPSALVAGGTIVSEPGTTLYPQFNYPQGFVGTMDEVAVWTTALSHAQVQEAMTAPVSAGGDLQSGLADYINFDQAPKDDAWTNQAPGQKGTAQGPKSGTTLVQVPTTVPTDPFPKTPRLPGGRAWGLQLMTPLAAPTVDVAGGTPATYKVALSAGDQLEISVPDQDLGTLMVQATTDLGTTIPGASIEAGKSTYLVATRTGTYQVALTWTPAPQNGSPVGSVTLSNIPGPLNNLMSLLTSYQRSGPSNELYSYAYADPSLPALNPDAGSNNGDTAAASYWPLWSDARYFPVPGGTDPGTWASALSQAYAAIVAQSTLSTSGFANLIGVTFGDNDFVADLQASLADGYRNAYGTAPPQPPGPGQFFLIAPDSPQNEVYEFFYNANVVRQQVASVLNGTGAGAFPSWVSEVIAAIGNNATPDAIKSTIEQGQFGQSNDVKIKAPSDLLSGAQIFGQAVVWGLASLLTGIAGLEDVGDSLGGIIGGLVTGAGASIAGDFIGQAGTPAYESLTVPFTPITNNILAASKLDELAANLTQGASDQWTNIQTALNSTSFVESYLSNFGLLEALQTISGAQLGTAPGAKQPNISPQDAATQMLARASWSTMIPAVYHWAADPNPYDWPAADGRTTLLSSQEVSLGGPDGAWDVVAGHFFTAQGDSNLDLAVTNYSSNSVSILKGQGDGTFKLSGNPVGLAKGGGPLGLAVGHFVNGDTDDDLVVADYSTDEVTVLLGDGFGNFPTRKLVGLSGPDGAWDVVVGDFDNSGNQGFAVTNSRSGAVSIVKGDGLGNFTLLKNVYGLKGPHGIVAGNFDGLATPELAVAENGGGDIAILQQDAQGNYDVAYRIPVYGGGHSPDELVAADFNGDGRLDLAVTVQTDVSLPAVSILLNQGGRNFQDVDMILYNGKEPQGISVVRRAGSAFPDLAVTYRENISDDGWSRVAMFYNQGGSFSGPINITLPSSEEGAEGIVAADFANDGNERLVVANYGSSDLTVVWGTSVGNFATFQPGTDATSVATALGNLQALQGGNNVRVGPINDTGQITPASSTPPDYLGYISLPYYPAAAPLNIVAPGVFLVAMPATMQQSVAYYNYQRDGTILAAWRLEDVNKKPMALSVAQAAFGVPRLDTSGNTPVNTGTELAPVDPARPFAAINGGWYGATQLAPGAYGTLADAFFNWGQGIDPYSTRILVPGLDQVTGTGTATGTVPGTSTTFPNTFNYTITYRAATDSPPSLGTAVNLAPYFDRNGIVPDGVTYSGGLDGIGDAYSAQSLPRSVVANGVLLNLNLPDYVYRTLGPSGSADRLNVVSKPGQTIALPAGRYSTLTFLGCGVFGAQANQVFTVTYSDGSTQTFTQSLSDWFHSSGFPGETVVASTTYLNKSDGTTQPGTYDLYGYSLTLDSSSTIKSITLPNNNNIRILAMTLS